MHVAEKPVDVKNTSAARAVPFPPGIRAAAVIWIGFGMVGFVIAGMSIVLNAAAGAANPGQPGGTTYGAVLTIMMSLAFFLIGLQTIKGSVRRTLAYGIWSIAMGLVHAIGTIFLVVLGQQAAGGEKGIFFMVAGVSGLLVMAMLTAGLLAISGRHAYAEWRLTHGLADRR